MKFSIIPITIFAALIVFIVVAGMEFRYENVRTVQSESLLKGRKTFVSVSATEVKHVKSIPIEETRSEDRLVPAAIPVLSPEEAIKANEEALKQQEDKKDIEAKFAKNDTNAKLEDNPVPKAIPVVTPDEAIKANNDATKYYRTRAIIRTINVILKSIGLNYNRIHFLISLLPLLFIVDALKLKKERKEIAARGFNTFHFRDVYRFYFPFHCLHLVYLYLCLGVFTLVIVCNSHLSFRILSIGIFGFLLYPLSEQVSFCY